MYELTRQNFKEAAIATILEIWTCIDWERVDSRRAYGIWDEFASKVKASAMSTNKYEVFVEKLCKKMDVRSLRHKMISDIGKQRDEFKTGVLKLIREETVQLILEVRLNNEARKEMNRELKAKKEKEKKLTSNYNDTQVSFTEKGVKING